VNFRPPVFLGDSEEGARRQWQKLYGRAQGDSVILETDARALIVGSLSVTLATGTTACRRNCRRSGVVIARGKSSPAWPASVGPINQIVVQSQWPNFASLPRCCRERSGEIPHRRDCVVSFTARKLR
jgi:hypothetical protein